MWVIGITTAVFIPAFIVVAMIARAVWVERSNVRPPTRGGLLIPTSQAGV